MKANQWGKANNMAKVMAEYQASISISVMEKYEKEISMTNHESVINNRRKENEAEIKKKKANEKKYNKKRHVSQL